MKEFFNLKKNFFKKMEIKKHDYVIRIKFISFIAHELLSLHSLN